MNTDLPDVDGAADPPRRNGELVFEAPWQSRVFGLCAAIVETCFEGDREPFRQHLIAAITAEPDRPYWDSWTLALQQLAVDTGLLDELAIERRIASGDAGSLACGGKHSASPTLRCWALDLVGGSTGMFGVSITG